jgi:RNA polymerase sigma factor (TIGR02999 family)
VTTDSASHEVTRLLVEWRGGRAGALDELLPLVYDQLRRLALRQLRAESPGHLLQPTALVNELYLVLVHQRAATGQNRAHFLAIAAQMMRRILVDHARSRLAAKRGGGAMTIELGAGLDTPSAGGTEQRLDVIAVDSALTRLGALDPGQAYIVELRFFAGLTVEETAQALNQSPRTVKREWRLARAWLHRELQGSS